MFKDKKFRFKVCVQIIAPILLLLFGLITYYFFGEYCREFLSSHSDGKAEIFRTCKNFFMGLSFVTWISMFWFSVFVVITSLINLFSKRNNDEYKISKNIILLVESIICILVMAVLMSCIVIFIQV